MFEEDRQLAADCVVDRGSGEGDEEMKKQAQGRGPLSFLKGGGAKSSARDGLQEPLDGDALGLEQG